MSTKNSSCPGPDPAAPPTTKPCVLIGSNGINLGCGVIAVALEDTLVKHGYHCVHFSSGQSAQIISEMGREVVPIIGYVEKYSSNLASWVYTVFDYVVKNTQLILEPGALAKKLEHCVSTHNVVCYISVLEGLGAYWCYYKGIPVVEVSDMLYFKLRLNRLTDTERDFEGLYNYGLDVAMAPYSCGQAITLNPDEIPADQLSDNVVLSVPYLSSDVLALVPLPLTERDRVTVYVSGSTRKEKWLYGHLARVARELRIPVHVFFPSTDSPVAADWPDLVFHPCNRAAFLDSCRRSFLVVTNAGMQTAYELVYLRVRNFALPTQNHHAQSAVAESVQRNRVGFACLLETQNVKKKVTDLGAALMIYTRQSVDACKAETYYFPQVDTARHLAEQERQLLELVSSCSKKKTSPHVNNLLIRFFLTLVVFPRLLRPAC